MSSAVPTKMNLKVGHWLPVAVGGLLAVLLATPANSQQLVYQPLNPAFGGPYVNYQWMLQSAELQTRFREVRQSAYQRDPIQDFEDSLQRQILSSLSRELIMNRFRDLDLTQEGRYDLGDFIVEIQPGLSGVSIKVFNVLTGDESTVTIPSL